MLPDLSRFRRLTFAHLLLAMAVLLASADTPRDDAGLPSVNRRVLQLAAAYPADGTHDYWWPRGGEAGYDGCTADLFLLGEKVMSGEPQKRTFCCGLTLEVFLRAYGEWLAEHPAVSPPLTPADWPEFQRLWFVVDLNGPGPSAALEKFKMGRRIPPDEALAGDFVQIWRTQNDKGKTTGHSVIFLAWVRNDSSDIIGMKYWSTQPGTAGIRENIEYYGPLGGISTEYTYFARVELPLPPPS